MAVCVELLLGFCKGGLDVSREGRFMEEVIVILQAFDLTASPQCKTLCDQAIHQGVSGGNSQRLRLESLMCIAILT